MNWILLIIIALLFGEDQPAEEPIYTPDGEWIISD
jgi:hypothetical protein